MKHLLPVLNQIRVASPCPAKWEDMTGDERVRFCGSCEKHVYNLSAMTAEEVVDLVRETEGHMCARFYQRADGTVLTSDCPEGVERKARRRRRFAGVFAALSSFFLSGCLSESERGDKNTDPLGEFLQKKPERREAIAGGLCPIDLKQLPTGPQEEAALPAEPNR